MCLLCYARAPVGIPEKQTIKKSICFRKAPASLPFFYACMQKGVYICLFPFRRGCLACRRTAEKRRTAAVHRKGGAGAEGAGAESDAHKAGNGAAAGPSAGAHAVAGKNGTAGGAPYAPPYFRRAYAAVLSVL